MKKSIFGLLGIVAIAAICISNSSTISELQQQNVAALADTPFESGIAGEGTTSVKCYSGKTFTGNDEDKAYECGPTGGCISYSKCKNTGSSRGTCNAHI